MLRSILIFPQFANSSEINLIRKRIDPLYKNIRPHVSLVFPFDSPISDDHLITLTQDTLKKVDRFKIELKHLSGDLRGGYLWFEVGQGQKQIEIIHDSLYKNLELSVFLRKDIPYIPHLTVGQQLRGAQVEKLVQQLNKKNFLFESEIKSVSIEHILPNNDSDEFSQLSLR
ncbi:2'-5' RNA ligase family protein [Oenococcus oeni]|uniref:2'-5' RNA ligase family protein n=1 Tax=Oenococcus oeni TaxID=1247 RepID=UPI0010B63B3A|nr:2'-5' RNA ligase family protein [Oenococcus oeni]SYW20966.1 putative RNA ligase or phosphoesterase [Oenococcus oeni]